MKKALIGVAALALMLPHAAMAATDGQPGATSTGSFDATLTVNPPGGTMVQVLGLDDFDLGTTYTSDYSYTYPGSASPGSGFTFDFTSKPFCLLRSDAGDVRVHVVQTNFPAPSTLPSEDYFGLVANVDHNNDGLFDVIPIQIHIKNPQAGSKTMRNNTPGDFSQSGVGCTAASDFNAAHALQVVQFILPPAADLRLEGAHTAQFTMTVSVP